MKKIIIIGCPGSGKSTFARKLSDITNIPLYHLDMIWHKPDKTTLTKEEFDEQLRDLLQKSEWIIDGNYQRTLEVRIKECDTIFFAGYSAANVFRERKSPHRQKEKRFALAGKGIGRRL